MKGEKVSHENRNMAMREFQHSVEAQVISVMTLEVHLIQFE
jgi:hypothetical protein